MINSSLSTKLAHTERVIDESLHRINKAYARCVRDRARLDNGRRRICETEALLAQAKPLRRATFKVLIVEDNELNMKLCNDLLKVNGYTTLQAENGLEALRFARLHRPDLILMEIGLPDISGLEV